tara:strand:- start:217 stop:342 length:126 start_codon:yes stop_codon:yes gene_type:complete
MTEFPMWGYAAMAVVPVALLAVYAVGLWVLAKRKGAGGGDG